MAEPKDPPDEKSLRVANVFRRHYRELLGLLLRSGADRADAEDALQNTWLNISKPGIAFLEKRLPKSYLLTTAVREWLRLKRRNRSATSAPRPATASVVRGEFPMAAAVGETREPVADASSMDPEDAEPELPGYADRDGMADALVRSDELEHAYAALSREEKEVCNLMIEGLDADEIASGTGLTPDQVERRMTAVKKRLRRLS
jgi:RNA polymerase sigma factor (sigma-70 family)